jgi:hypothetical protein
MQHILFGTDDDRVAGIAPTLVSHNDIGIKAEKVNDLPFALIAPLGPNQQCTRHLPRSFRSSATQIELLP